MARGLKALTTNDPATALRWLERAHRLAPLDANIGLMLAGVCFASNPERAALLFLDIAKKHDVRQAWLGLATIRLNLFGMDAAAEPLAAVLSRHAFKPDTVSLAQQIGARAGSPGWCALRSDGTLEIHVVAPGKAQVFIDAKPLASATLPSGWERSRTIDVMAGGLPLLGSPIQVWAIRRTAGCVEVWEGGIRGWAWHPNDPETLPVLTLYCPAMQLEHVVVASDGSIIVPNTGPLAVPRSFEVRRAELVPGHEEPVDSNHGSASHSRASQSASSQVSQARRTVRKAMAASPIAHGAACLPHVVGLIHVRGSDGKDLLGSPLDPFADEAAHVAAALSLRLRYSANDEPVAGGHGEDSGNRGDRPDSRLGPFNPCTADGGTGSMGAPSQHGQPAWMAGGSPVLRADGPVPAQPLGADSRKRPITVVIPVHDGGTVALACLTSVLASLPAGAEVLVVDDCSSDPALIAALDDLARSRKIGLIRHPNALGFPASANAGIRATAGRRMVAATQGREGAPGAKSPRIAQGRDVVLLNSDTLVPPGWLERLRDAAYSAQDIGTVTPLSNDASILSYPGAAGDNPRPDQAGANRLDRFAQRANGGAVIDIPVGVGFCLYLRRDCLSATGLFRADLFAQGYGEENDFCLRARRLGWRNVALTGLFVGHVGGGSFGDSATHLRARNGRIVEQLHPGHDALVNRFCLEGPLAVSRRRIDIEDWRQRGRKWRDAVILIAHDAGGGVEQRIGVAVEAHAQAGRRPIVLRPAETANGQDAIAVRDGAADTLPNLVFAMPVELPALLRLLRAAKPSYVEAHHLADYPRAIYDLIAQLGLPYDVHVHDYAWFCPRISLVGAHDRYCGEPDLHECEACIADNGSFLKEALSVAALRDRSSKFLLAARRVVTPSGDTGSRMRRHFDGLATVTVPHGDDSAIPHVATRPGTAQADVPYGATVASATRSPRGQASGRSLSRHDAEAGNLMKSRNDSIRSRRSPLMQPNHPRVCLVGSIGVHKGFDTLLACARDAARRDLGLTFVVVGHTIDDDRVMDTGRVFVTGRFSPNEAIGLIADQNASIGFVASIWPETWCLALGDIWAAGLSAAAFDIGAPAERIRQVGKGILLPLGLSASAINNTLVAAIRATGH